MYVPSIRDWGAQATFIVGVQRNILEDDYYAAERLSLIHI